MSEELLKCSECPKKFRPNRAQRYSFSIGQNVFCCESCKVKHDSRKKSEKYKQRSQEKKQTENPLRSVKNITVHYREGV